MPLPTDYFPRIVTLSDSSLVRVTRCDTEAVVFDRVNANGYVLVPAQAVAPIAGFDPTAAVEWPTDAEFAHAIETFVSEVVPVLSLSPLSVILRMTPTEQVTLFTSTNPSVILIRTMLIAAGEVRSDDPLTAQGKQALVSLGILTQARADEIYS